MVGATSSKFCPVLPFGKVTVRCRVHPRLINPCSCAAASRLRTLFSTCITTNNFCMKITRIPDSVIVCFGILILRICYHTTKKDFLHLPTAKAFRSISDCVTSISTICQQHILLSTVIIFPPFHCFSAGYMKKFHVTFNSSLCLALNCSTCITLQWREEKKPDKKPSKTRGVSVLMEEGRVNYTKR